MKYIHFFQGPDGENSSKRLIGIVGGLAFIILCLIGGMVLLYAKNTANFLDVIQLLGYFSSYHLTTGLVDHFLKKRT